MLNINLNASVTLSTINSVERSRSQSQLRNTRKNVVRSMMKYAVVILELNVMQFKDLYLILPMREVWISYTITNVIHSMKVNTLISLTRFVMSLRIDNVILKTKENVPRSMLQSVRQFKKDLVLQSTIDNVAL